MHFVSPKLPFLLVGLCLSFALASCATTTTTAQIKAKLERNPEFTRAMARGEGAGCAVVVNAFIEAILCPTSGGVFTSTDARFIRKPHSLDGVDLDWRTDVRDLKVDLKNCRLHETALSTLAGPASFFLCETVPQPSVFIYPGLSNYEFGRLFTWDNYTRAIIGGQATWPLWHGELYIEPEERMQGVSYKDWPRLALDFQTTLPPEAFSNPNLDMRVGCTVSQRPPDHPTLAAFDRGAMTAVELLANAVWGEVDRTYPVSATDGGARSRAYAGWAVWKGRLYEQLGYDSLARECYAAGREASQLAATTQQLDAQTRAQQNQFYNQLSQSMWGTSVPFVPREYPSDVPVTARMQAMVDQVSLYMFGGTL